MLICQITTWINSNQTSSREWLTSCFTWDALITFITRAPLLIVAVLTSLMVTWVAEPEVEEKRIMCCDDRGNIKRFFLCRCFVELFLYTNANATIWWLSDRSGSTKWRRFHFSKLLEERFDANGKKVAERTKQKIFTGFLTCYEMLWNHSMIRAYTRAHNLNVNLVEYLTRNS